MRHAREVMLTSDGNGKFNKCSPLTETMIYDLLAVSQISRENVSTKAVFTAATLTSSCRRRNGLRT